MAVAPAVRAAPAASDSLRVGRVVLAVDDIFTPQEVDSASGPNRLLRVWMNRLHVNTRGWVIRQELLFHPGDPFRPARLAETERNLRQLGYLTDIQVVPVDTTPGGEVTVEVRGRETWTLSANLSFTLASDGTLVWNTSLTEKNFLGYGVLLSGTLGQDQDVTYGRLAFEQSRFLRSPFDLRLSFDTRSDGHDYRLRAGRPFRQDAQGWAARVEGYDLDRKTRYYLSHGGPAGADPAREASLHVLLPFTLSGGEAWASWRLSPAESGRVWRAGVGLLVEERRFQLGGGIFELSDDRVADVGYLGEAGSPLARDQGTLVLPYLRLATHGREWDEARYVLRYGHAEDIPLAPAAELDVGLAGPATGSTAGTGNRVRLAGSLQDWSGLGSHWALLSASGAASVGSPEDRYAWGDALAALWLRHGDRSRSPTTKLFAEVFAGDELRGDQVAVLGLDRGLRTLGLDGMAGDRLVRWNVEHGKPIRWQPLDLMRIGWAVFYDGGLAWFTDEDRDLGDARHEFGLGLRFTGLRSGFGDLGRIDVTWSPDERGPVLTTVARGTF